MKIESYERRARNSVKEQTLRSRLSALRRLEDFIGEDREPEVEDVEKWAESLIEEYENDEISSATVRQYYKAVRYYYETMGMDPDDINHISKWLPSVKNDPGAYLDKEEWELLRSNAYQYRDDAIIEIMYRYGRRPSEVILINMDDVDFDEGTITFNILKKDEPFRATFELIDVVERKIKRYLKHRIRMTVDAEYPWEDGEVEPLFTTGNGRISYDTVRYNIKKIASNAGIEKNIIPKSMRHSRATHLDWEGTSPEVIARQQLIHEPDSDVIGAYIHDREEDDVREPLKLSDETEGK